MASHHYRFRSRLRQTSGPPPRGYLPFEFADHVRHLPLELVLSMHFYRKSLAFQEVHGCT